MLGCKAAQAQIIAVDAQPQMTLNKVRLEEPSVLHSSRELTNVEFASCAMNWVARRRSNRQEARRNISESEGNVDHSLICFATCSFLFPKTIGTD